MEKKVFLLLLVWIFPYLSSAQEFFANNDTLSVSKEIIQKKKDFSAGTWSNKHIDLCFSNMTMSQDEQADFKSNYGAAFVVGCTYFLHKSAIRNILKFGIDATWVDLNYSNYNFHHKSYWGTEKYQYHQIEYSMHVGISLHAMPVRKMLVKGYFHYVPTFSSLYVDNTLYGNYASLFCAGGSISYNIIGLGLETRFGNCSYKDLKNFSTSFKKSYSGIRTYITIRL